jgi:hypothetical protein
MAALKSADQLKATSGACLIDFLRTDLAMCSTFADVAKENSQATTNVLSKRSTGLYADAKSSRNLIRGFTMRRSDKKLSGI